MCTPKGSGALLRSWEPSLGLELHAQGHVQGLGTWLGGQNGPKREGAWEGVRASARKSLRMGGPDQSPQSTLRAPWALGGLGALEGPPSAHLRAWADLIRAIARMRWGSSQMDTPDTTWGMVETHPQPPEASLTAPLP